jgi:hypothetical protein
MMASRLDRCSHDELEQQALEQVLSPEDPELLLRWTTWSGAAPPRPGTPPGAHPAA